MSVTVSTDVVREFDRAKEEFSRARGFTLGGKTVGPAIPNTTWGDVLAFSTVFLHATKGDNVGLAIRSINRLNPGTAALNTASFISAREAWMRTFPQITAAQMLFLPVPTIALDQVQQIVAFIDKLKNAPYPRNVEFWETGQRYAIAASASGALPSPINLAIESVREAAAELPENLAAAASTIVPNIPEALKSLSDILKWSLLAGLAFGAWWLLRD